MYVSRGESAGCAAFDVGAPPSVVLAVLDAVTDASPPVEDAAGARGAATALDDEADDSAAASLAPLEIAAPRGAH